MSARWRRGAAGGLVAGTALSCSLLVSGEPEPLRCAAEGVVGPPACDPGFKCQAGTCRAAVAASGGAGASSLSHAGSGGIDGGGASGGVE